MSIKLYIILFVAPLVLAASVPIDQTTLYNVFGYPQSFSAVSGSPLAAGSVLTQAQAVTPANFTLTDPDYWDSPSEYNPTHADYDSFDWTLTKRVAASSEENFLLSPLGLKLALAILTEAATGATKAELSNVLGFEADRNAVRRKFSSILGSLKTQSSQYILNLGSRIYIEESAQPRQRFAAIAEEFYKTEVAKVDFRNPSVAVRDINNWVSNITQGKIPNLVDEDDVASQVVLILNTLYFKGTWHRQFALNATGQSTFYVSPNVHKQVPFMNVKDKFYYKESTKFDAKILRMPYLGNKFSMFIIVPNSLTGLPRVFNSINELRAEISSISEQVVSVTLPRFQFDYTSLLDGILKELGIRQAFEDMASLPGIASGQLLSQRLKISRVLQRSGIEVNEVGSIAYSATEVSLVNKFGEDAESYVEVIANKPFLFFIEDELTRQLLFTGRVSDPTLADGAFKLQ